MQTSTIPLMASANFFARTLGTSPAGTQRPVWLNAEFEGVERGPRRVPLRGAALTLPEARH
jgi:hypothetical protein